MTLIFTALLALPAFAGEVYPRVCDRREMQRNCMPLTAREQAAAELCRAEMKAAGCDEWEKTSPHRGAKRNCDLQVTCPESQIIKDNFKICAKLVPQAWKENLEDLYNVIFGEHKTDPKIVAEQDYLRNCVTPDCKRKMLGPHVALFTKEEIEGHPNDGTIDPGDPANQNYLQGFSASTLHHTLLRRLRDRLKDKRMDQPFYEPWSGEIGKPLRTLQETKEAAQKSFHDMVDDTLRKMGVDRPTCYDPMALAILRCHAGGATIDPTILLGATAKAAAILGVASKAGGEAMGRMAARKTLATAADKADDALEDAARIREVKVAGVVAQAAPRNAEEFVEKYSRISIPNQSDVYVNLAKNSTEADGRMFTTFTNVKQKELNDRYGAKTVDAINNRVYSKLQQKLEKLKAEFPDVKAEASYNDWKSFGVVEKGDLPTAYRLKRDRIFAETLEESQKELGALGMIPAGQHIKDWYRAASGATADQANLSERISRDLADGGNRINYFDGLATQKNNPAYLKQSEALRIDVQNDLQNTGLLERAGEGPEMIPNKKVMEIYRKTNGAEEFQATLRDRAGVTLDAVQVATVRNYLAFVDVYNPQIYSVERVFASLDGATMGGIQVDKKAMGAVNLQETAKALVRSGGDPDRVLIETRRGEMLATRQFVNTQRETMKLTDEVAKKHNVKVQTVCSGDDCATIVHSRLTPALKRDLIKKFSRTDEPAGRRVSFVGDSVVSDKDRAYLGGHGETVEKYLRKNLAGKIPDSILDKVTFGVDMTGTAAGQGDVRLLIGNSQVQLRPAQFKDIEKAFRDAVSAVNARASQQLGRPSSYVAGEMPR
ncbi:MAG TPA: hypothetical protein PKC28_09140 [Bdellovibrionales bacterium]|nr:hypothetical protein [Bdellovibrionales bacterium]